MANFTKTSFFISIIVSLIIETESKGCDFVLEPSSWVSNLLNDTTILYKPNYENEDLTTNHLTDVFFTVIIDTVTKTIVCNTQIISLKVFQENFD